MATAGPRYPGTVTTEVGPSGDNDWTNPGNVSAADGTEAQITAATYDAGDHSYRLKATNFGFDADIGALDTIDGITVEIHRRDFAGDAQDQQVQLYDQFGTLAGTDKQDSVSWPATLTTATYGGSADTWTAGLTAADIRSANFGVALIVLANSNNTDIGVDYIRVTVEYTPGPAEVTLGLIDAGPAIYAPTVVGGTQTYVSDTWARAGTDTWGSADTGGDYTGDGSATDIVSGRGVITHSAAANTVPRLESATTAQDVEGTFTFQLDKLPTGTLVQIRSRMRMDAGIDDYYQLGLEVGTAGELQVLVHPLVTAVQGTAILDFTHPSLTIAATTDYTAKWQLEGVSPTTIRVKVWETSGSEPSAWDDETTNSEATLQAAGTYALAFRTTSSVTNFPIACSFDNWTVTNIPPTSGDTVVLGVITSTSAVYAPTITTENDVALGVIDAGPAIYALTVSHDISLGIIDAGSAIYAPTLAVGPVTVELGLIDAGAAIYAVTIAPTYPVTLDLIDGAPAVYGVTLALAPYPISLGLIDGGSAIYAVTVALAPYPITLGLVDGGAAVYDLTVVPGPAAVTLGLIDGGSAVYAPTVAPQAVGVALDLIDGGAAVYGVTVAATYDISLGLIDGASAVYAPTLATENDLTLGLIDAGPAIYDLTVTAAGLTVSLGVIDGGAAIYDLTVVQDQFVSLDVIDAGAAVYAPTVIQHQFVSLDAIESTPAVYDLTVAAAALGVTLGLIDGAPAVYGLTVATENDVSLGLIDAGPAVYDIEVTTGTAIVLGLIDAGPAVYDIEVIADQFVDLDLIDSGSAIYAPTVASVSGGAQSLTPDLIDSGSAVYAPTITVGAVDVTLPLLDAGGAIYALSIAPVNAIVLGLVDGTPAIYAPELVLAPYPVALGVIDSGAAIYAPEVAPTNDLGLGLVESTPAVFDPVISAQAVTIGLALLDGVAVVYAPIVTGGAVGDVVFMTERRDGTLAAMRGGTTMRQRQRQAPSR